MIESNDARAQMVNGQVRVNDVTLGPLLDAMDEIPRHRFVPKGRVTQAYADMHVQVNESRWLLRPRDFAKLIQALEIEKTDLILDVACARGYSTAILARLGEMVIGLEDDHARVERAGQLLSEVGADNTAVVFGELQDGAANHGPFDVIFVNGAVEHVPQAWCEQLSDGGRLGVFEFVDGRGVARVFTKTGSAIGDRVIFDAVAPLLPGFSKPKAFSF